MGKPVLVSGNPNLLYVKNLLAALDKKGIPVEQKKPDFNNGSKVIVITRLDDVLDFNSTDWSKSDTPRPRVYAFGQIMYHADGYFPPGDVDRLAEQIDQDLKT